MAEKKKSTGLPYTMYINRNLARFVTKRSIHLTPNQITVIGFIILLIGLILLPFTANTLLVLISYLLLAFSYVLDSVDGQLARVRNMCSPFGEWLDHSLDGLRMILLQLTFLIVLLKTSPNDNIILIILGFSLNIIAITSNYFFSILKQLILKQKSGDLIKGNSLKSILSKILLTPADYGIYIMSVLFLINTNNFLKLYILYGIYYSLIFISNFIVTVSQNLKLLRLNTTDESRDAE
ncbi:MAG: CDP-alcohol phosphatidyltransferase family protein [Spirochaetales bacterium]|uniref:CDP-alcohol phosphatidyltransferase family protein n=1 Tax=Candidatus Thalassospirochaeta sargassi TaxID=3119039 RepID=A0AAJ1IBK7_9SPIO|nr:CDP-alcohol phosphatidyltransferase family protein [Spirochaetales bacterium]